MANFDPGNRFTIVYTWLNTTGFAFDRQKIAARLPGAPVDSWRMVFDPAVISHFQDCGIAFIDSATDIVQAALIELGKDPNSEAPEDLAAAEALLTPIRKYLRAPHPDNASLFLNYLLRPDIAARITNVVGFANGVISSAPLVREDSGKLLSRFALPPTASPCATC
jgi:putrescine transport system substrate-binding protein